MTSNQPLTHKTFISGAFKIANSLRTLIIGVMLILGILFLNVLDVALGGFTYSSAFANFEPMKILWFFITGYTLGWALSISLWFVQYVMWSRVFKDGKVNIKDIPFIVIAILLAIFDTFGDSAPVLIYTTRSVFMSDALSISVWGTTLGKLLIDSIFWAVVLLAGFSEVINTFVFEGNDGNLFPQRNKKPSGNPQNNQNNQNRQNQPFRPTPTPFRKP